MRSLRLFALCSWAASIALTVGACSDDDTSPQGPTEPPELEIVRILSNDGTRWNSYVPGDDVDQPCDDQLTVRVGPADNAGRLLNWELRPPGNCGRINNCGYVVVRILEGSRELARGSAAAVNVPVDVANVPLGTPLRVSVELRQGTTGELFTVQDTETNEPVPLIGEAALSLRPRQCPSAPGGGGGMPGSGLGGAGGNLGDGGQGGFAGSLGVEFE
jgi:hypothetical protein